MKLLLVLIALTGLLSACGGSVAVTEADDGDSVTIDVGDELEVALPANPSTGFSWLVVIEDPSVLEQVGDSEFEPESDLVGAGGVMTLRFSGRAEGTSELRLEYRRPFEDAVPEDTVTLTVIVG